MKTVLIVEDEKMIRQGIKTMVQRSGVPVEIIMECNNGETALEILREQKIDVMFTDIRMPKMDGIQLVQRMQEFEHKPLTVAISGYDDFSYAVEMMRQGVREYILKPVERTKITEILKKLDKEIAESRKQNSTSRRIGRQQLKYIVLNEQVTAEEVALLEEQYGEMFFEGSYYVCCKNTEEMDAEREEYIFLNNVEESDVFIVREESLPMLLRNELLHEYVGVSSVHSGISALPEAYQEALRNRKQAFCTNREVVYDGAEEKRIPEAVLEEARKLVEEETHLQRVQLLGTDKTEDVVHAWNAFFYAVRAGRLSQDDFEKSMKHFLSDVSKTYRNMMEPEQEKIDHLEGIFRYPCIDDFEEDFMDWLLAFHEKINSRVDANGNKQKIQQAVDYIKQNYNKNLNMAVVSNEISMNYSLFSYSFKQYTGSNFVNYLKNLRVEEAKRLLADTDMRVIEISREVGYDNEKHFMKIFKSTCGVSPSEYRKNMQLK